jgi:hypothetical protein
MREEKLEFLMHGVDKLHMTDFARRRFAEGRASYAGKYRGQRGVTEGAEGGVLRHATLIPPAAVRKLAVFVPVGAA